MNLENIADDVRLVVAVDDDDFDSSLFPSSSSVVLCRICHEEEDESSTIMESPCGCSGTLRFAHRGCIQKWCDEKGSTVCEICLQKFEPGYTVPPKLALLDVAVTIRGSLEVPRLNYEAEDTGDIDDEPDSDYPECSPPSDRTAIWFRSIALIYMLMLLARQLIIVASNREGNYPFALTTVLLLRASGIVLPFYFIMRVVAAIQKAQQRHRLRLQLHASSSFQSLLRFCRVPLLLDRMNSTTLFFENRGEEQLPQCREMKKMNCCHNNIQSLHFTDDHNQMFMNL